MTVETWTQTADQMIQGTGPYTISHPYGAASIVVSVVADGAAVPLDEVYYTLDPAASDAGGQIYLTPAAAAAHDGARLRIDRVTPEEQGWVGLLGEREKGLEAQLDRMVMRQQEIAAEAAGALRVRGQALPPIEPVPGAVVAFDAEGVPVAGPLATDVAAAQGYALQTGLDAAATAADRVQTGLDAAATAADRVQTGLDAAATAADRAQTGLDAAATAADRVQTGLDAAATAADRAQTGLDAAATAADRAQTGLDAAATAADRVQTGLDAAATGDDALMAAQSLQNFLSRYLGIATADPALDGNGDPVTDGATYFNSATNQWKVRAGGAWVIGLATGAGAMLAANNLSDLASVATARANLGLSKVAEDAAIITDWNAALVDGFFTADPGAANAPNAYAMNGIVTRGKNADISQLLFRVGGDEIWFRRSQSGTWAAWVQLWPLPAAAQSVWDAGTDTVERAISAAKLAGAVAALAPDTGIGVGQTWQDVTASRSSGTSYQNTTGKPIFVEVFQIYYSGNNAVYLDVSPDGVTWTRISKGTSNSGTWGTVFGIIPDGWYYKAVLSRDLNLWTELR